MEDIIILGGGESVKYFDFKNIDKLGCYVIGVNDACLYAPVDCIVTMDRLLMENRFAEFKKQNKPTYLRYSAYKNNLGGQVFPGLRLFACDNETDHFGVEGTTLNGRNSGYCALNLAYTLQPRNLYLLGFDMKGGYWYPEYPWAKPKTGNRSMEWVKAFEVAKHYFDSCATNVYVVGDSLIETFPKLTYMELIEKCGK